MNKLAALLFIACFIYSCGEKKNIPDVSGIQVQVDIKRFDEDFFAADTAKMEEHLNALQKKYPSFLTDYLYNILAVPPQPDSVVAKVKMFLRDYRVIYDSAQRSFASIDEISKQIDRSFQFVKYYFPEYKLPHHVIMFIGPVEGYANVLTTEGLAVGLQLYLGKDFPIYHTDYINAVYPEYQSRRFDPQYIPVNCIKNIIDDIYPDSKPDMPLAYQMVEAGKKLYVLDQLLPETADSLKTGYTQKQLDGCFENEGLIWNYFLQNNLLYETDPSLTREYMNDGPKTELLGDASPGFIGQFVGWQIVKKWMEINKQKSLPELLHTPAKQIFEEAKYKPR
ncbi:MAG TPA: hypothetical protein PKM63_08065 [Panacibacter sp.]|nr:hypothetical protein [Panacibacter sp.]HNP44221.1 hypothetical protein [Panacibacter sp.]